MLEKIELAIARKLISQPAIQNLPQGAPFAAATCAIHLPLGCAAPVSGAPRRIAAGYDFDAEKATFLAASEAIERYSLQYAASRPQELVSFRSSVASPLRLSVHELCLGSPTTNGSVDSKFCAAGKNIEEASKRALLETIEHLTFRLIIERKVPTYTTRDNEPGVQRIEAWLQSQFRQLSHLVHIVENEIFVVVCRCTDFVGSRPCYGSAAAFNLEEALVHSSFEAVFHWINMVAIEYRGTSFNRLPVDHGAAFAEYRGIAMPRTWPSAKLLIKIPPTRANAHDVDSLLKATSKLSGARVHLFDMSVKEIEVPTIRAVIT